MQCYNSECTGCTKRIFLLPKKGGASTKATHIFSAKHISLGKNFVNSLQDTQIAEFANSVDLDEVAHNEPPHLDLHCLPSTLGNLNML